MSTEIPTRKIAVDAQNFLFKKNGPNGTGQVGYRNMPVLDYRKASPIQAAFVGSRLIKQGPVIQGVGTNPKPYIPRLPASRASSPISTISKRGRIMAGIELGGRRRSRKTRKTRKHKKTHRRR
jgi:hypothetical protein